MITTTTYRGYTIIPAPEGRARIADATGDSICTEAGLEQAMDLIDHWVEQAR